MSLPIDETRRRVLGSAEIRRALTDFVRKRVAPSDVDDVVQMVLLDALASSTAPENRDELRKWLMGVARNKIADLHRKGSRERPAELPEIEVLPPPVEEQELVRWAEREAGKSSKDGVKTLAWMAREGEGDKLEHIGRGATARGHRSSARLTHAPLHARTLARRGGGGRALGWARLPALSHLLHPRPNRREGASAR